jgi:hypothetical protein
MQIEDLKARIYFLAGQLEEAKKYYADALGEIERATKEQAVKPTGSNDTGSNCAVPCGDSTDVRQG